MDKETQAKVEDFKKYRIVKPPLEIIEHYKAELQAIQDTLDIVSGKWKMQIIALLCNGAFRFSELEKGLPKITPRMLSKELKDLEQNELIVKTKDSNGGVIATYCLTDYGYTLVPLIIELTNWGVAHRKKIMRADK